MSEQPRKSKHSNRGGSGRGNVWKPTAEERLAARFLAAAGATPAQIAIHMGKDRSTIDKHLRKEAEFGRELADQGLVGKLYRKAMGSGVHAMDGDTGCLIYLAKVRLGWWDRPPMFTPPHPNDIHPPKHEELCVQVTYRYSNDPQALAPPPADRLAPPTVEARAEPA